MPCRILIAGGGTGGHLFPALAVAQKLKAGGADVLYIGTKRGIEAKVISQYGIPIRYLWLSGFSRRRILSNLLLPLKVLVSLVQSFFIVWRFRPQVAVGTGGYVCGPILLAAALGGVPLYLQEQNSFPGFTTRLLSRFAAEVFLNFEEASRHLPTGVSWQHSGNPLRPGFKVLERRAALEKLKLNPSFPTLLVFGGSQGAQSINRAMADILPDLSQLCNLIWSRGQGQTSEVSSWRGPGVLDARPFIDDMPSVYAAADLAVCRSGAVTLSELQAVGLPSILVPYPFAAGDHQRKNAETFCRLGGSIMILDVDLSGLSLLGKIVELLKDKGRLESMRNSLQRQPQRDAAALISDELLRVCKRDK